jgi:hypothetical protein
MKDCTLGLLYFCKYGEVVFMFGWTVYSFVNGFAFMHKANKEDEGHLRIMAAIGLALITIHLSYMNLLINLRYWMRI